MSTENGAIWLSLALRRAKCVFLKMLLEQLVIKSFMLSYNCLLFGLNGKYIVFNIYFIN